MQIELIGLLAAILVIMAGLVIDRVWRFYGDRKQKNSNSNPGNSKMFYEVMTNVTALKTRLETFAQLTDGKLDDLRERVTKLEMQQTWDSSEHK